MNEILGLEVKEEYNASAEINKVIKEAKDMMN